ncbi:MAG: hypothetical protein ACRBBN_16300 [Methyloligellaceae bacterium]
MKFSKSLIAGLALGVVAMSGLSSAQAFQPLKGSSVEAESLIVKVDHHGKCYKWKHDDYGKKYCYQWRYKSCYKWKYDDYGKKYCYKWKWNYYYSKDHGGHKGGGYGNY